MVTGIDAALAGSIHLSTQLGTDVTLIDIFGQTRSLTEFSAVLVLAGDTLATVALADSSGGVFTADMLYLAPDIRALAGTADRTERRLHDAADAAGGAGGLERGGDGGGHK